eukprot:Hpha_TRINITY_DN13832_c0_g1::TRINITY_DN13832_c0_g1_i1::g.70120::m.70120
MPALGACLSNPRNLLIGVGAAAAAYLLLGGGGKKGGGGAKDELQAGTQNVDREDRTYTAEKLQRMFDKLLPKQRKEVTREEWMKHTDLKKSFWILLGGALFEVADFHEMHPGGSEIYEEFAAPKDATPSYLSIGHSDRALKELAGLYVGHLV